jgi:glycosyltransferase involved in cell wall biosynthesis
MDIVIIANFVAELDGKYNSRFSYLAKQLAKNNDVELISSDFSHTEKVKRYNSMNSFPYKVTLLSEPGYKTNVCLKRFYSHYIWGRNIKKYLAKRKKPDVIYCAVPSLTGPWNAAKFCKKNNIRYIIDIQDLWPEAFKMIFKMPIINDIIFMPFKFIVDRIYKSADEICAVSETYVNRAFQSNRKKIRGHIVFLGTELATFDENVRRNLIERTDNQIWIAYCGTLGSSYDITCVIEALYLLEKKGVKSLRFIIMGDGPKKKEFEKIAENKCVDALFTGNLPYEQMCGLLSACDIAVNPITRSAAQSIINKHADYAASGLPVISTQENKEYRKLVHDYKMGINCGSSAAKEVAEKLQKLIENPELRIKMGKNSRKCAEEKFDRAKAYSEIVDLIIEG